MKILIKVTKEILERSKMCGIDIDKESVATNCAIAEAIREIFPLAGVWSSQFDEEPISDFYISVNHTDGPHIALPHDACSFVRTFDALDKAPQNRPNLPEFSFEIDVPQEVIEKIGINEVYKILSESKTLELVQP